MPYYPGYRAPRKHLEQMGREALLELMDDLYSRPAGWEQMSLEELRREAESQHDTEWTIPAGQHHHYPDAES